jgi:hypothetical protein
MTGLKDQAFDLLGATTNKSSPLISTLDGVNKALSKGLAFKTIKLITHDNQKRVLRADASRQYPYGYTRLRSIRILKDRINPKVIRRHGSSTNIDFAREITIDKGFMFPSALGMELTYVSDDILDVLQLTEKLAIIAAYDGFTFQLDLPGVGEFFVSIRFDSDDFAIPDSTIENEEDPQAMELTFSFTVETHLGIVKQVAKINQDQRIEHNTVLPGVSE